MYEASTASPTKLLLGNWLETTKFSSWVYLRHGCRELWAGLRSLSEEIIDDPWCILGDFNAVIDASEVCGRAADTSNSMAEFRDCIRSAALVHLPFTGCPFSWHNCSEGSRSLWKRLDRALVNEAWVEGTYEQGFFKFDNFLAKQPGFLNVVRSTWRHPIHGTRMYGVVCKLKALKSTFRAQRKEKLVQWCRTVYCIAVKMENNMLQQWSKLNWLKHGDQCSKIFFRKINARRARQRIYQISNSAGVILTDTSQSSLRHILTVEEAIELTMPVTAAETKEAFFDISEDSAPGPDGYPSAFYKAAWPEIGADLCAAITEFFHSGRLLKQINATLLVLILKVQLPVRVSDYRPIACCNVIYKVITKILVRRMQQILHLLIDHTQTTFVPGRSISDNVFLAQEVLAGYNQARLPPRCTIKVDIQKAYDSSTSTIKDTLAEFAVMSGLQVNPSKSQIILSKAVQTERQAILDLMGFQEGSLPIKYLGVPLISSRLTIADCQPLIDKIDKASWMESI
ncbi:UNVERIFIED_CONTAM: hypothetical protein Slati_0876500 [Sesamum latifolium]|uniref:Reverse transcriptase domain-containing protein n=1 Tax=Sesamum latifolium TaxID=2727402 RepID=A0AAW2XNB9_9LAMI